jgi:hypothetical protein
MGVAAIGDHMAMRRRRSGYEIILGIAAYAIVVAAAWIIFRAFGHATVSIDPALAGFALAAVGPAIIGARRLVFGATGPLDVRAWFGMLAIPALLFATTALGVLGIARDVRWHGSEPAFRAEVTALRGGSKVSDGVRLGSYTIDSITTFGDGYLFEDADGGDLTDCGGGFAYLPGGPGADPQDTFWPLDGDWYVWTCSS